MEQALEAEKSFEGNASGYLSEDKTDELKTEEEIPAGQSSLNKIMENLVKGIMPKFISSKEEADDTTTKIELVGDKLRKKRNRTKRRSGAVSSYKKQSNDRHQLKKYMGRHRSVVRYIGSNVPITPQNRQYFELFDNSSNAFMNRASSFISNNLDQVRQHVDQVKYSVVPTLADLGQLVWEDLKFIEDAEDDDGDDVDYKSEIYEDVCISLSIDSKSSADKNKTKTTAKETDPKETKDVEENKEGQKEEKKEETQKINDLQDELAKLRAQIAMIVAAQSAAPAIPAPPPVAAPIAIVPPTMQSIPPPPPPPPPPPSFSSSKLPITPMKKKSEVSQNNGKQQANQSNMSDVLKGIANVKLKSTAIEKSPGGTPMRKNDTKVDSTNPADIIARALREKFQNSNFNYQSPENSPQSGFTPSPPSRSVRPTPKPRPRPRPRVQKKLDTTDNSNIKSDNNSSIPNFQLST